MLDVSFFLLGLNVNSTIASGDFTNIATNNAADGVYTLNGTTVTIGDIIDLDNEFAVFNPETDIDAGGLKVRVNGANVQGLSVNVQATLISEISAGAGFTTVFDMTMADKFGIYFFMFTPGFGASNGVTVGRGNNGYISGINLTAFSGDDVSLTDPEWVPPEGPCKIAFSLTTDHMAISLNGSAVYRFDHAGCAPCDYAQFSIGGLLPGVADGRLRSFAFYELASDADLPTLSAL